MVVVLIAITVTLVSVNLERDVDRVAALEANRFAQLLEQVRDESVLTGRSYAVDVNEASMEYSFLTYDEKWIPVKEVDFLRPRRFPEPLSIRMELFSAGGQNAAGYLMIQGLGEITPFRLEVTGDRFSHSVRLDDSANLIVEQQEVDAT